MSATATVEVHLDAADLHDQLCRDARVGLTAADKWIPATWFYDEVGCDLFDQICELPEYYPTRTERSILTEHADDIARLSGAETLVELGSGTSEKTALLIDALSGRGTLQAFVPFDVAAPVLREATRRLALAHPGVAVHGVVGDFRRHLPELLAATAGERRLVVFLGGTIGNLNRAERRTFYATLAAGLTPDDTLLVGTDLVKAPERLVAAYDDAAGMTARFNLNVLKVLNSELDGDFRLDDFDHVARWNADLHRIEMRLRARRDLRVRLAAIDLSVEFARGEELLSEISCKFTPAGVAEEFRDGGFEPVAAWCDPAGDFQLTLGRPRALGDR